MILVGYDITNDSLRLKIANKLISHGLHRIQYSLFVGNINRTRLNTFWKEISKFSKSKSWSYSDSIILIPIHRKDLQNVKVLGSWPERWDEITGKRLTLIL